MKTHTQTVAPAGFFRLARDPKALRRQSGKPAIQHYCYAADWTPICAGVHYGSIDARSARLVGSNLTRWRKWYDRLPWNRRANYPAKNPPPIARVVMFPVENPKEQRVFSI